MFHTHHSFQLSLHPSTVLGDIDHKYIEHSNDESYLLLL